MATAVMQQVYHRFCVTQKRKNRVKDEANESQTTTSEIIWIPSILSRRPNYRSKNDFNRSDMMLRLSKWRCSS